MEIKIPFALREGNLVHISDISKNEKGLGCNCRCIECGEILIARIGEKNTRHFSHYNKNTNCTGGVETGLHIFAKEILLKRKQIVLPRLSIIYKENSIKKSEFYLFTEINNVKNSVLKGKSLNKKLISEKNRVVFDDIYSEQTINDIRPDIIIYKNGIPLIIELAVTHFIDKEKKAKIKRSNISTIEIDLKKYKNQFNKMSKYDLERVIIYEVKGKRWIYNRNVDKYIIDIIEENKKIIKKQKAEEDKKNKEESRIKEEKQRKLDELYNKKSLCRICNRKTEDWIIRYGTDNTCICRECRIGGLG